MSTLISSVSFTPTELVKPRVRCDAHHHGNMKSSHTMNINIHFPPRDVSVEVNTMRVREGGSVQLVCVCKADPPVTEYKWSYTHSSSMLPLPHHTHFIRLYNVTRHTHVQCSVRNALGQASSLPTHLKVQYAPTIVRNASVCVWDAPVQKCVCVVDSNPHPQITWSVNGSDPPLSFNTTSSHTLHTLQKTLWGNTHTQLHTTCYAFNHLGNDTHTLRFQRQEATYLGGIQCFALHPHLCCPCVCVFVSSKDWKEGKGDQQGICCLPQYCECVSGAHTSVHQLL
ncbi:hypothetical protein HF521_011106 [Silurus meridionalis]|uniref:Ig-like domain-containing protein n=1 Tax=Silurus meridionalis TaxID=175797 RepID=A0A8T0AI07_SILME|nr:hypothetical protein HF521_011106 [Silurus meridionalis]